jgi:ribulose 1,5-bisphosphate synthetase/thiazole synthase
MSISATAHVEKGSMMRDQIPDESNHAPLRYETDVRVVGQPDVLVVGGGPAGIAAAISSARNGAATTLIEKNGFVGGNLTAGLVGPCMTSYSLDGTQQLIKGVFEELVLRMEEAGGALHPSKIPAGSEYSGFIVYGHDKVTPFDPEAVKLHATEMLLEAGVSLRLHTFVADTIVEDGAVRGVITASKSGLEAFRAEVTVDCSADADVAVRGGAKYEQGRLEDGLTQPMTMFFRVANVDDDAVRRYVAEHPDDYRPFASIVAKARAAGEFPIQRRGVGLYKTLEPGVWRINTTRLHRLDGTDVRDLTTGEIDGRRQVASLMRFFRKWLPGFEGAVLLDTAAVVGVRETRRIVGDYVLTAEDLAEGREFDDVIALCGYPVDIHSPTDDGGGADGTYKTANVYQIPYRCLLPANLDGVLVAGRALSATHEAQGATRVMPPAFAMGEAAGAAAAISVKNRIRPRDVSVHELQRTLIGQGAYLGEKARWLTIRAAV